jgi:two-component system LytT family response regulator
MVKCLIIDDEKNSRDNLANLLSTYCPDIEILGLAKNGSEGIAMIQSYRPDAVFLDIHMTDMDGFTVLAKLTEFKPLVVFVTAFEKYALRAIKASAIDYLLKPVSIRELQSATKKLEELVKLKGENPQFEKDYLESLHLAFHKPDANYPQRLALPTHNGYRFEQMADIIYLNSDSNYTTLFLRSNEKVLVSKPMKHFEDILDESLFVRIHNSYIINLGFMKNYSREDGGSVELSNGITIQIAKRRLPIFLEKIKTHFVKP